MASFLFFFFFLDGMPWLMNCCMPTLTSSSSHTVSLSILILPTLTPFIYEQAHALQFISCVEYCDSRVFYFVCFLDQAQSLSGKYVFTPIKHFKFCTKLKDKYNNSSTVTFFPLTVLLLCIIPSHNLCLRRGQMAGFKHLSTDEWSYLPGCWALFWGWLALDPLT